MPGLLIGCELDLIAATILQDFDQLLGFQDWNGTVLGSVEGPDG